jgi:hypothetical protein
MAHMPEEVSDRLRSQRGAVTRAQALRAGMTTAAIRTEVRNGRWNRAAPGVYVLSGSATTWEQALWVAHLHLGPDSCISHEAAGRLHGLSEVPGGIVSVSIPHSRRPRATGVRIRRVDDLAGQQVVRLDGLPVTALPRTIVDLASVLHVARLRLLVERVVIERKVSLAQVGATLAGLRRQGKPGVVLLGRVLDDLGPGDGIPNGELERLFDELVTLSGLPAPVHEHPLPGVGPRAGFVDRCWPEARLIIELDGRKWHTRRQQVLADHDRLLQAQAAGYETTRLLWEHVRSDGTSTAAHLRVIHARRTALLRQAVR